MKTNLTAGITTSTYRNGWRFRAMSAPAASSWRKGKACCATSASGSLRTAAHCAVMLIKPNNTAPASYVTASILTLPSGCAASTSKFTRPSGLLKTIVVFIQSNRGKKVADHCLGWDNLLPDATSLGAVRDGTADGVNDIV